MFYFTVKHSRNIFSSYIKWKVENHFKGVSVVGGLLRVLMWVLEVWETWRGGTRPPSGEKEGGSVGGGGFF